MKIMFNITTYPHPPIPAARLFLVFLCCWCALSPGEILKSGVGMTCWVPTEEAERQADFRRLRVGLKVRLSTDPGSLVHEQISA